MLSKGFGGAERYFVELCLCLAEKGMPIQAICHTEFVNRHLLENQANIQLTTVSIRGTWDVFARRKIERALTAYQPDLVHAHMSRAAYVCGKITQKIGLPLTAKTHNYVNMKYFFGVDQFIPTTQDQKAYLIGQGIPEKRITVIPNFSRILPSEGERALPTNGINFITYGRFVKKKGFNVLVEAFAEYLKQGGEGSLSIGGSGNEFPNIESMVKAKGLTESVHLLGWIDDVNPHLDAADVFVLSSLDEPFGIVILEAMASGIPIVSTKSQGPKEILSSETARLVEIGDVADLTQAMLFCFHNPLLMAQRAKQALALYTQRYHAGCVVPRIIQHYEGMLEQTIAGKTN